MLKMLLFTLEYYKIEIWQSWVTKNGTIYWFVVINVIVVDQKRMDALS